MPWYWFLHLVNVSMYFLMPFFIFTLISTKCYWRCSQLLKKIYYLKKRNVSKPLDRWMRFRKSGYLFLVHSTLSLSSFLWRGFGLLHFLCTYWQYKTKKNTFISRMVPLMGSVEASGSYSGFGWYNNILLNCYLIITYVAYSKKFSLIYQKHWRTEIYNNNHNIPLLWWCLWSEPFMIDIYVTKLIRRLKIYI